MLTHLIALGLFASPNSGAGSGFTIATPERTVTAAVLTPNGSVAASAPLGAPGWSQILDPGDHAPFAYDFTPLLGPDEKIASIDAIKTTATAALLGVRVDAGSSYGPIIDYDGKKLQVWFYVDVGNAELASFVGAGTALPITFRIITDAVPPKRFERSAVLTVRQQ